MIDFLFSGPRDGRVLLLAHGAGGREQETAVSRRKFSGRGCGSFASHRHSAQLTGAAESLLSVRALESDAAAHAGDRIDEESDLNHWSYFFFGSK